jgi:hypothetical protein
MDIEDEEPWLRGTIKRLRKAIPLVGANHHAEATFHTLGKAMERRLAALERRRLDPHDQEDPPGG